MRTARGSAGRLALSPVQATSAAASRGCRLCASDCAACADANPRPPCAAPAQEVSRRGLVALAAACLAASEAWTGQAGATSPEVVDAVEAGIEVYDAAFSLSLLALQGSVQQSWVQEFKQLLGSPHTVRLKNKPQLKDLYANLESGDVRGVDLVSVGDTWMGIAISQGLIRPFRKAEKYSGTVGATTATFRHWDGAQNSLQTLQESALTMMGDQGNGSWWARLPLPWKTLVRRSFDGSTSSKGPVWGAPYRWGCTVVGYRQDKLRNVGVAAPRDWSDLLHPKFKGRIAFPASSRGLVGIALKTLGLGFNSNANDLRAWGVSETALKKRVQELKRQALLFDDREHVRAFAFGDAWLVVGSSLDVMALSATVSQARLFVPASGTTLWADLFVQPSSSKATRDPGEPSPLIPAWLDFILSPSRSVTTTGLKSGLSPLLLPDTGAEGAPGQACGSGMNGTEGLNVALDVKGRFLPPGCVLQRSEFLLPLDRETTDLYNRMLG